MTPTPAVTAALADDRTRLQARVTELEEQVVALTAINEQHRRRQLPSQQPWLSRVEFADGAA